MSASANGCLCTGIGVILPSLTNCSSSRNALALIRDSGAEPTVVEYLKTPPSRDELLALVQRSCQGVELVPVLGSVLHEERMASVMGQVKR